MRFLILITAALILTATKGAVLPAAAAGDGLILVEGGSFSMGSPSGERQRQYDETPHTVTVDPFYVDPYEVTQKDYLTVMGENPSHFQGEKRPVENVTWFDAVRFCNALSSRRGLTPVYSIDGDSVTWDRRADGYRLLTEAEWEYVCRAGTTSVFNVGGQVHSDLVNFEASYPYLIEENYVRRIDASVVPSRYRGETLDVGSLNPNAFGLYDTHGNVSEWVWDYYGEYDLQNLENPAGPVSGSLRVNRGGSYIDFGKHLRSAYRSAANPLDADQNLGFRIARNSRPGSGVMTASNSLRIAMPEDPKILIAYFSHTGNTENAAQIIQRMTGGDLLELQMSQPYRGNIYDVSQRDLNAGFYPPLRSRVENMVQYDVILLGYPTWWATMPMPVFTFLDSYDFSGKIIVPFSSHGGTMFGDSVSDLSKMARGAYIGLGLEFNYSGGRGLAGRISQWLTLNGIPRR